jgi:hypothetical protein
VSQRRARSRIRKSTGPEATKKQKGMHASVHRAFVHENLSRTDVPGIM